MNISAIPRSFVMVNANNQLYPAVVTGYFAGKAWLKSDEAFQQVSGDSFGVLTFDDDRQYKQDKRSIQKPTIEDWNALSNENKVVCYTRWADGSNPNDPSKCVFY